MVMPAPHEFPPRRSRQDEEIDPASVQAPVDAFDDLSDEDDNKVTSESAGIVARDAFDDLSDEDELYKRKQAIRGIPSALEIKQANELRTQQAANLSEAIRKEKGIGEEVEVKKPTTLSGAVEVPRKVRPEVPMKKNPKISLGGKAKIIREGISKKAQSVSEAAKLGKEAHDAMVNAVVKGGIIRTEEGVNAAANLRDKVATDVARKRKDVRDNISKGKQNVSDVLNLGRDLDAQATEAIVAGAKIAAGSAKNTLKNRMQTKAEQVMAQSETKRQKRNEKEEARREKRAKKFDHLRDDGATWDLTRERVLHAAGGSGEAHAEKLRDQRKKKLGSTTEWGFDLKNQGLPEGSVLPKNLPPMPQEKEVVETAEEELTAEEMQILELYQTTKKRILEIEAEIAALKAEPHIEVYQKSFLEEQIGLVLNKIEDIKEVTDVKSEKAARGGLIITAHLVREKSGIAINLDIEVVLVNENLKIKVAKEAAIPRENGLSNETIKAIRAELKKIPLMLESQITEIKKREIDRTWISNGELKVMFKK